MISSIPMDLLNVDPSMERLSDESDRSAAVETPFFDYPKTTKNFGKEVIVTSHMGKEYKLSDNETVKVLSDIHLFPGSVTYPIRRGEFVMLRGPSGCGKSTLLNIFASLDRPTYGKLSILDQVIDKNSDDKKLSDIRLKSIGIVFQTFNLIPSMSALEAVELPMVINDKLEKKEIRERATNLLTIVGLRNRISHLPSELSDGERQRIAIARAMANNPELLLLDEPTGDLDTKNTIEIMNLLLELNLRYNTTCIMISHNQDVECYADRLLYLEDGEFHKQVINTEQTELVYADYIKYINKKHS